MTSDDHFYTQCKAESFSLTWNITDFSFADGTVQSSIFTNASEESKWTLLMFTCGVPYEEYLSLYFHWISGPKTGIPVKGRMAILNSEGEEAISRELDRTFRMMPGKVVGFDTFARLEDIMNEETGILQNDTLTVTCELHLLHSPENTQRSQVKVPECSMADDLGDLWDQSLLPDCSLVVAGQEFQAHKAILAARCPVFRAMFMHNMMERQTNRVEIHEMEPEVLKELLTFIYSGKAPNLQDMAAELLVAADMYLLDRLKRMCEEALCRSLTVENAAEILIFADLYLTPNLKEKAITFINQYSSDVMRTPGWKTIQKDHPYVMAELFHSLVSAGASPSKRPRHF
ncbi:speckle-type POZ protein-like [Denticeps clupeoides]|uniref:speckle-type POZ protein-like n=1 Tax=Denticeps clupeoides TaxID=299321 RepID=UPI0010A38ADE|nr:speckle-type POZ protein-like [Denticeps clupeoides]